MFTLFCHVFGRFGKMIRQRPNFIRWGACKLCLPSGRLLTVKIRQPSHEFTFGVGMSFIPYPLVLTPVV
jgi:hypothetical protein